MMTVSLLEEEEVVLSLLAGQHRTDLRPPLRWARARLSSGGCPEEEEGETCQATGETLPKGHRSLGETL